MPLRVPRSSLPHQAKPGFWVEESPDLDTLTWDLFVGSLGFERRSRFFLERHGGEANRLLISAYDSRRSQSYVENLDAAYRMGASVDIESDSQFVDAFQGRLFQAVGQTGVPRVLVDVSSCSRTRLAAMVSGLLRLERAEIDFVYTPGVFQPPPDVRSALSFTGPVLPAFAGLPATTSSAGLTAIFGLGYEALEALGALQLLEASEVWALLPVDEDKDYYEVVAAENDTLIEMVDADHVLSYDVLDAVGTFQLLEQLVYGTSENSRPVIVPLGPKVFALAALLTSARFNREVPVWRFSSDQYSLPLDVSSSGEVSSMRVQVHAAVRAQT